MSIKSLNVEFVYSRLTDAGNKEHTRRVNGLFGGALIMITGIVLAIITPLLFTGVIPPGVSVFGGDFSGRMAAWSIGSLLGMFALFPIAGGIQLMCLSYKNLTRELSLEKQTLFLKPQENRVDPFYTNY